MHIQGHEGLAIGRWDVAGRCYTVTAMLSSLEQKGVKGPLYISQLDNSKLSKWERLANSNISSIF